ncbi:MAG: terpene cyclase/mutase family protein [Verrucomicrobiae bacterium]|nr:terpene cyclase/mutase family protein [Verrucomicrobiae bacterium]
MLFQRLLAVLVSSPVLLVSAQSPSERPKPAFQYQSEGIAVPPASAEEPRVPVFGPESVRAARRYLEDGALSWVREKNCINCHTTGPYLSERPALSPLLGPPNPEIVADFADSIPEGPAKEVEKNGLRYISGSWTAIWCALGLAEWDRHVTGKISPDTDLALRQMMSRQSPDGSFVSYGEVEIPHITTDFELSLQAARALRAAPDWLAALEPGETRDRVDRLKAWLRTAPPKNDFDRVLRLQLGHYFPELVTAEEREKALALLGSKQHEDGGWSTRDFSAVEDWHYQMSDTVTRLIASLPDAADPESDPYLTALAIVLMRQSGVPAENPRIRRGLGWLKREQRISGRWWMHSLYRGNYHYITYIATAQALKALSLCDELPDVSDSVASSDEEP